MNIDNDIAFKRMTGRKIDTLTGKIYHLEYNPPPDDEPVNIFIITNLH